MTDWYYMAQDVALPIGPFASRGLADAAAAWGASDADKTAISVRIAQEIKRGHDPEQAAAIAYAELGEDMDPEDWTFMLSGLLKEFAQELKRPVSDGEFKEDDHPRDESGKFGSGGGSEWNVLKLTPEEKARGEEKLASIEHYKDTSGGWGGKDYTSMTPLGWNMEGATVHGSIPVLNEDWATTQEIPLSKLVPSQGSVTIEGVKKYLDNPGATPLGNSQSETPKVFEINGKYHIDTGHHRLSALLIAGREKAPVRIYKLVETKKGYKQVKPDKTDAIALDAASVRHYDDVGRLHVDRAPISKANVCPYYGHEIPGGDALGLDANRVYRLFRDPVELARAAETFNGIQVLIRHVPVTPDDHRPDEIVGTTGTTAGFEAPYLMNGLVIWAKDAIDLIEAEEQKELSSGYRYRPDMTPGEYDGEPYDGVMRDIVGNHVALVRKGRAGSDVVVGDAAIEPLKETNMPVNQLSRAAVRVSAALAVHMAPRVKADQVPKFVLALDAGLADVTAKNFASRKAAILKMAKDALDPSMLTPEAAASGGAGPDDVMIRILDMVEPQVAAEVEPDPNAAPPPAKEDDEDPMAKVKQLLMASGLDEAACKQIMDAMPKAGIGGDAPTPGENDDNDEDDKMVSKEAMDAALKSHGETVERRVLKTQREIAEARAYVRPWVGELAMDHESAESVLRDALVMLGVDGAKTLHAEALRPVLGVQPLPGRAARPAVAVAMDSAAVSGLEDRFPHMRHIHG